MTTKVQVFLFPDDKDKTFRSVHVTCAARDEALMREIIAKTKLVRITDLQAIADVLAQRGAQ